MIKTNNELDSFVYRVSHDLRAPLTSSLGLIELCTSLESVEDIKKYLQLQKKSLHKLDQFIRDILHYSQNSRLDVIPEKVNLKEFIRDVFDQYQMFENFQTIDKIVEIEGDEMAHVDMVRFRIILSNLISNAIKFSNKRSSSPYVKVVVENGQNQLCLKVSDNGLGIGVKHIEKIFTMFYRATDQNYGSGLGLYIVKEAVEKLGGKIAVSSDLNKGASFSISLPKLSEKEEA